MAFRLDERLAQDCFELGRLGLSRVLLMNNAGVPWFILVPETACTELHQLPESERQRLHAEIQALSEFVNSHYSPDKLNVAAIGNIVRQLHVHVVGRHEDDYCWPGVVWGTTAPKTYPQAQVDALRNTLLAGLTGFRE